MLKIIKIKTDQPEYQQVLELRDLVLRKPLGMDLFKEDLSQEKDEIIFGLFDKTHQAVGSVQFKITGPEKVKLRQMAIHPEHQRKGLGKKLVLFSEQQLKAMGYKSIEMHARKTALPFYWKLGYEKFGKEFTEVGIPHYKMHKKL